MGAHLRAAIKPSIIHRKQNAVQDTGALLQRLNVGVHHHQFILLGHVDAAGIDVTFPEKPSVSICIGSK